VAQTQPIDNGLRIFPFAFDARRLFMKQLVGNVAGIVLGQKLLSCSLRPSKMPAAG